MQLLEEAAEIQRCNEDWIPLRLSLNMMSVLYAMGGYYGRAMTIIHEALELPSLDVGAKERGMVLTTLARLHWHLDERKRGTAVQRDAVDLLIYNDEGINLFIAYLTLAKMALGEGDIRSGEEWLWRAEKQEKKLALNEPIYFAQLANVRAKHALLLGDENLVQQSTTVAYENVLLGMNSSNAVIILVHSALFHRCQGDFERAVHYVKLANEFLSGVNDRVRAIWFAENALVLNALETKSESVKSAKEAMRLAGDRDSLKVDFAEDSYLPELQKVVGLQKHFD